jgi:glycosyltransferase involved in cell wall biosynthesis
MSAKTVSGLVSVIVASYNHAEYLEKRMDSLINQTYQNIEILVIDDCSTDNSVEVLQKYEAHPKVNIVIREGNGGWVGVSNQGVDMSVGEFIIFANCDDACDLRMIERLLEGMLANSTAGITYCCSLMIDENGKLLGDDFVGREKSFRLMCNNDTLINSKMMSRFLLHSCVIPNLSAALFRRESYVSAGGLKSAYRVCSDWDLFFRIAALYDVAYIAAPLNQFRQHKTTIRSSTKDRIMYEEIMRLLLGQITLLQLTAVERIKYRLHVMYLWSVHILRPSISGVMSFIYLLRVVLRFDPIAICCLPLALILRVIQLPMIVGNNILYKKFFWR